MPPIDPATLPGMPAPFWFVEFFKVLGFCLHLVPMNLWYAGIPLAMWLAWRGDGPARRWSARLMTQMPVLIAFGVNFGIVPLLFAQVGYYWAFYPATILMAWFWLGIILLLIPAYYGVYAYSMGLGDSPLPAWRQAAGWGAAVFFVAIGFLFANGWSLMTNTADWKPLWLDHNVGGAATGLALNVGDPSLWPRWLMLFGLALLTTAAWTVIDAAFLARRESDEYRSWARSFAWRLAAAGMIWFAVAGSWYAFGTWPAAVRTAMWGGPLVILTLVTAAAPGLTVALAYLAERRPSDGLLAAGVGLAQFAALALNATSRQIVQNVELAPLLNPASQIEAVEWSPLVAFLLIFVAGAAVIAWMVAQIWGLPPHVKEA